MVSSNPRLTAFLTNKIEEVKNELTPVNWALIEKHYSSLNFGSKNKSYWIETKGECFQVHLFKFCMLLGIRKDLPDGIEIAEIKKALLEDYPQLNENSIVDAINKNMKSEFSVKYESYNRFNVKCLHEILTEYFSFLKKAHILALKARDKHIVPPEPTEAEKKALLRLNISNSFNEYKQTNDFSIISYVEYDFFDRLGVLKFDKDKKLEFMRKAKIILTEMHANSNNIIKFMQQLNGGEFKDNIVMIAKRLAVEEYYKSIDKLPF